MDTEVMVATGYVRLPEQMGFEMSFKVVYMYNDSNTVG